MFRVCICDNQVNDAKQTYQLLCNLFDEKQEIYHLTVFNSLDKFINIIQKHYFYYDIVILTVSTLYQKSFEIARTINQIYPSCQIIYLTDDLNTAREISGTRFSYYIFKSDLNEKLQPAIEATIKNICHSFSFLVKQNKQFIVIDQKDIIFLERDLRITKVHTANQIYTISDKLTECYAKLNHHDFVHVHRSFIVNAHHIKEYNMQHILLDNGYTVSISRQYKNKTKDFFDRLLGNKTT